MHSNCTNQGFLVDDLPNEEYHAGSSVSKSHLDTVNRSPLLYQAFHLDRNRPRRESTPRQLQGTLAHCAILEPAEFEHRYVVTPQDAPRKPTDIQRNAAKPSAATVEAIAWWDDFYKRTAGKEVITQEQSDTAWKQAASVLTIPDVAEALASGRPEVSAFWTDEETGLLCKCRPDWVHDCGEAGVILVDIKTTQNAAPDEFARSIAKWRYHVQDAWYSDGYAKASGRKVLGFVFVAVEMDYPYAASAVMLDDESRAQGRIEAKRNLNTIAACHKSGEWPGYSKGVEIVSLPAWAKTVL